MKITTFSHFFSVTEFKRSGYERVKKFAFQNFAEYDYRAFFMARKWGGGNQAKPELKRIYASYTDNKHEFRFHIHTLEKFTQYLDSEFITYEIENVSLFNFKKVEYEVAEWFTPRADQVPHIDYMVDEGTTKMLNLPPGAGKTASSLYSCAQMGGKIIISLETRFFNIWKDALLPGKKQVLKLQTEEVMFIQGSKDLKALIELGIAGALEEVKVFVIASRTMGLFIEAYERANGDLEGLYGCNPEDLHEVVDAPIKIKDEVHLGLHANFKEVVNTHTHKYIALSGTLEDGSFRDTVFAILFPKNIRSPDSEFMKYIEVTALMYTIKDMHKVRTSHRGMSDYSHNAFEQSILKDKNLYKGYLEIVSIWLQSVYVDHRQKGMRAAIFVESIELATAIHTDLTKNFGDLTFGRYCASTGDKYKEAREADVLITTVKSFGTGFDMEDLYCAFMTNSIRSQNTNIQVLFRLRQLKNFPGIFPKFYYLVCSDIPKHLEYHEEKKLQFSGKVKSHVTKFIGSNL